MNWIRVDNRLVHGQIIEAWLPFTGASVLAVVNDALAEDFMRQEIMSLAIPGNVRAEFLSVDGMQQFLKIQAARARKDYLALFATCQDAMRAHLHGMPCGVLNLGNLHYGPGKKQVCAHVALSREDENCLDYFRAKGVELDFRCVPNEPIQVKPWT